MSTTLESPLSSPRSGRARRGVTWEKWGWIYMRASGILLVILIFGHLFINLMVGEGISAIDFAFVAGKYASPFWQVWDIAMLWLALIHGANGMRTLVNDYAVRRATRLVMHTGLLGAVVVLLVMGTLVIVTFDPCPQGVPTEGLPAFCTAAGIIPSH